jgi:Tol biopolymer transport system component/tRNA A-37 threonylcarbamoyl transferase component Bud32
MTAGDWKRVKAIALDAAARPESERAPFITSACSGDTALCREVVSLVGAMTAAGDRYDTAPWLWDEAAAAIVSIAGRQLGAYEVLSRIGAGGMGEVYRARDTRLNRIVAVKVLPAPAIADPMSRERMLREARAAAALNHPHICAIYDIGYQDGLDFLVMEFVEGETLASRLSRGKLPIDDAIRYAEQIAAALGEAHRAGIVHRDVKPANVMLTPARPGSNGGTFQAKLLDFGVAKANESEVLSGSPPPEGTLDLTVSGMVIGTAHYMAPEQFERNATDVRTDIFAFGAVLFEMLTGRRAFRGSSRDEVLAAIRDEEVPRPSTLRPGVPAVLDRVVARCLAKNAAERYQNVDDLLADLRSAQRRLESSHRLRRMAVGVGGLVLAAAGAATWVISSGGADERPMAASVTRLPASAGVIGAPALSPDGSRLAFTWVGDGVDNPELILLPIGSSSRVRLTNDLGIEVCPAWSPDGSRIAFVRCGSGRCAMFTLPAGGGTERKLVDLRHDNYNGLAWSPDGRSIVYAERATAAEPYALFVLSVDTLSVRQLTAPSGDGELRWAFSPDGRSLAIIRVATGGIEVRVVSFDTGDDRPVLTGQREWFGGVTWSADGRHLVLSANQQGVRRLWKVPVSGGALEQIAIAGEDAYYPSISPRTGRLSFVRQVHDWDFARATIAGSTISEVVPFPSSPRLDLDPAFSPDGRRLAFISERSGAREVWVSKADGTEPRQLTSYRGVIVGRPSWSPDGRWLAFHASGIVVMAASGGSPRKISEIGEIPTWSADGQWVYFFQRAAGTVNVRKAPFAGGVTRQTIATDALVAREGVAGKELFFARVHGGIWRGSPTGDASAVIPEFDSSLTGYWAVFDDGIYHVIREMLPDRTFVPRLRFFDFARRRSVTLGTLTGTIDDWVGSLAVSPDRRTVLYSQRTYRSSEIVLVEGFR